MLLRNKKGVYATKTVIIFSLSLFYLALAIFLSVVDLTNLLGESLTYDQTSLTDETDFEESNGLFNSFTGNIEEKFGFLPLIIKNISLLPPLLNIFLTALFITLLFLIISSLPTFSGGS